ncbi:MAG TPA: hypothetical protein VIJ34_08895 [Acidimicrobiales bacterium]
MAYSWREMPEEPKDEPTQETEQGATIPIPTHGDFFRDLGKVAKPRKKPSEAIEDELDKGGEPPAQTL